VRERDSTFKLPLDADPLWTPRHHDGGVSVAKLERFGWPEGTQLVADAVGRGCGSQPHRPAPVPPCEPGELAAAAGAAGAPVETAAAVGAECMVFRPPVRFPTWEEAADALRPH
jgi:hypothetical protein